LFLNFSSDGDQTRGGRKDLEAWLVHPIVQKTWNIPSSGGFGSQVEPHFFFQVANFPKKRSHLQIPIEQSIEFKFQYFIAIFHI